ncbi:hypothetical protein E2P84_42445 [Burkholderia cepacia]|uniref:Uncharacterized protein n=1 Tax=Burkholderia cepacia TaxID=292 RepID=A0AAX2RRB2_BURCE|nr:hypothetical protein [Burkholderia cepacia]TES62185.1 hypothetical protein E2P84_42445 [Burkholderia cepacia]TET01623.1 hypothetical protein E3D36_16440 [Burkholderia cepacia]TEU47481.1 hypothetical protein E3D37_15870 [Burkholderia cepacia]TEU53508.1 hypothetical protein E3D38_12260 [Burkholderia cepacia]TEV02114.1 hypothetical protein E3D40_13190 [Burkholderia cepacia]
MTEEGRQVQLREAQASLRERAAKAGKVRLEASVDAETKARLEAYGAKHKLKSMGAVLDAIASKLKVDR